MSLAGCRCNISASYERRLLFRPPRLTTPLFRVPALSVDTSVNAAATAVTIAYRINIQVTNENIVIRRGIDLTSDILYAITVTNTTNFVDHRRWYGILQSQNSKLKNVSYKVTEWLTKTREFTFFLGITWGNSHLPMPYLQWRFPTHSRKANPHFRGLYPSLRQFYISLFAHADASASINRNQRDMIGQL